MLSEFFRQRAERKFRRTNKKRAAKNGPSNAHGNHSNKNTANNKGNNGNSTNTHNGNVNGGGYVWE